MKCICANTRRAARRLTQIYEEELRHADMTPPQFELMGTLLTHPKLTQSELAEALGSDQTTLSRNLAILIDRNWIARSSTASDKRKTLYSVSVPGKKAWQRALPFWQKAQEHVREFLGDDSEKAQFALERLGAVPTVR